MNRRELLAGLAALPGSRRSRSRRSSRPESRGLVTHYTAECTSYRAWRLGRELRGRHNGNGMLLVSSQGTWDTFAARVDVQPCPVETRKVIDPIGVALLHGVRLVPHYGATS